MCLLININLKHTKILDKAKLKYLISIQSRRQFKTETIQKGWALARPKEKQSSNWL